MGVAHDRPINNGQSCPVSIRRMVEVRQPVYQDTWSGWTWASTVEMQASKLAICTLEVFHQDHIQATCKSPKLDRWQLIGSNWQGANTTVAGGWGMDIDRLRVSGKVIDGGQYYVSHTPPPS
jgi:hypothetical protein